MNALECKTFETGHFTKKKNEDSFAFLLVFLEGSRFSAFSVFSVATCLAWHRN